MIVAVLSTVILPLDGTYQVQTLASAPNIAETPHYIGHPDTKAIVEELGAIAATSKLFYGLQVGESAIAFPIKQGRSNRSQGGTAVNQAVTIEDLDIRLVTRIA
jgi:L-aminopeptidase/D-esterase-like protein